MRGTDQVLQRELSEQKPSEAYTSADLLFSLQLRARGAAEKLGNVGLYPLGSCGVNGVEHREADGLKNQ